MRWVVLCWVLVGCGDDARPRSVPIDAAVVVPDAPWPFPYGECRTPSDCDAATPFCCLYCGHGIDCGRSTCFSKEMATGYCTVPLCDPDINACSLPEGQFATCRPYELQTSTRTASIFRCQAGT